MSKTKLTIVYYSQTGANYQMSLWAKEAAEKAGAEVNLVKVKELAPDFAIESNEYWKKNHEATKDVKEATPEDIAGADAILVSAPTRFGTMPSQMKQFLDLLGPFWAQGKLANETVSAMSSASNPNGGVEMTINSIYTVFSHFGAIIVPPGYTDDSVGAAGGNPYGTSATVVNGEIQNNVENAVKHQATRLVETTKKLNS